MPWFGWVLLAVCILLVVVSVSIGVLRITVRGRRFLKLSTRGKVRCLRILTRDKETPWYSKALLIVVVGYLLMPFDLIPDFIPVLGQLDDAGVVAGGVAVLLLAVPAERFNAAIDEAERQERIDRGRVVNPEE